MSSTKLRSLNAYSDWETREGIVNVTNYVLSIQNNKEPEYPAKFTTKEKRNYDKKFGSDYFVETGTITGGVVTRGKRRDYTFREEKEAPTPKKAKKTAKKATKKVSKPTAPAKQQPVSIFQPPPPPPESEKPQRPAPSDQPEKEDFDDDYASSIIKRQKKLYYRPIIEGTEDKYRINNLVVYPSEKPKVLKALFNDLSKGAGIGIKAFYAIVTKYFLGITRKEAEAFLKKQGVYNISRPFKRVINRPVVASSPNERWGADLIEMGKLTAVGRAKTVQQQKEARGSKQPDFTKNLDKVNEGGQYTHILSVVDFFSGKVWAYPLKREEITTEGRFQGQDTYLSTKTTKAFKDLMEKTKTVPRVLQVDNGKEFEGSFTNLMDEFGIKMILTKPYASTSNGKIERVNEEIRRKIRDGFVRHNSLEWVKYLPEYIENINSQKPSRSKFSPNELWRAGFQSTKGEKVKTDIKITDKSSKEDIRQAEIYKKLQRKEDQIKDDLRKEESSTKTTDFKVGDKVRIKLTSVPENIAKLMRERHKNNKFGDVKHSAITYSPQIYTITKVLDKKPRRKKGETANDAEQRFKNVNTAKVQYTLKDTQGNPVTYPNKKSPIYFFRSDLLFIPKNSIPSLINTIDRVEQLNRLKEYEIEGSGLSTFQLNYIPFVD